MREIKFRAWDGKKLYYWDSIEHPKTGEITGTQYPKLFYLPMSHLCGDSNDWEWTQYTGLKDKNGKDIYEGDVVATEKFSGSARKNKLKHAEVFWDADTAGFLLRCGEEETGCVSNPFDEVIGNIYENPGLI